MNARQAVIQGLLFATALTVGCVSAETDESEAEGPTGKAAAPQVDGGSRFYTILQGGATVGSVWAGVTAGGTPVEYWVRKASYSPSAARTFTQGSQSCADWKASVCGSGWTGATYTKAVVSQTTLNCASPPDPCRAPTSAMSFLGAGSYRTDDAGGSAFAWTYVSGKCEYWAMLHTIGGGTSTQSPLSPGYSSLSNFETSVCAMSPVPATWFTNYYLPVADFCSASTC